jgi:hypothetical protein
MKKSTATVAPAPKQSELVLQTMFDLFKVARRLHLMGAALAPNDDSHSGPPLTDEDVFTLGEQLKEAADQIGTLIIDTLSDAAGTIADVEQQQQPTVQ